MKITRTTPDGAVTAVTANVPYLARIGAALSTAESTIRVNLAAEGIPHGLANEIAIAAYEGGYARAISVGMQPDIDGPSTAQY